MGVDSMDDLQLSDIDMRVDKIIDLVIISHRDTCPFLSRDGDKMCKHLKDCDMDCDYMSSFIEKINNMKYENR